MPPPTFVSSRTKTEYIVSVNVVDAPRLSASEHPDVRGMFLPSSLGVRYTREFGEDFWYVIVSVHGMRVRADGSPGLAMGTRSFTGRLSEVPHLNGGELPQWLVDFVHANAPEFVR